MQKIGITESKPCEVCQNVTERGPMAKLCHRCEQIAGRIDPRYGRNKNARILALKRSWDGHDFRCHYSGIRLVEDDSGSPRYITLDHRIPGKEDDIVIAASLVNDMKSNMDEAAFREIVCKLAEHFEKGASIEESLLDKVPRRKR